MAKPFKFRYVNEIVGSFVLVVVLVLIATILLAGHAQDWFTPEYRYRLNFPVEGSLGIQAGSSVEILGTTVGKVKRVIVRENGRIGGGIRVKGEFVRFIRSDTTAIVKKRYAVAGESYIELTEGKGDPLPERSYIDVTKDTELTEILEELLKQVRETTVPAMEKLQTTVVEYGQLASDLRDPKGPLMQLLQNLEAITAGLEKGDGAAGKVLRDPQMAEDLKGILDKIHAALDDVKQATAQLPPMTRTIGKEVEDLPGLVLQSQEAIREAERLIEGIQRNWLIRKNIPQAEPTALIPATEVRAP